VKSAIPIVLCCTTALLLLIGCGRRPEPRLEFVSIESHEFVSDVVFDVEVRNVGDSQVVVDGCEAVVRFTYVIPEEDDGEFPSQFDHEVEVLNENGVLTVEPGELATIPVKLRWEVATDSPRMLSVNQIILVIRYDASFGMHTAPISFVLATDLAARDLIPDDDSAESMRTLLRRFPGQASQGLEQLMQTAGGLSN